MSEPTYQIRRIHPTDSKKDRIISEGHKTPDEARSALEKASSRIKDPYHEEWSNPDKPGHHNIERGSNATEGGVKYVADRVGPGLKPDSYGDNDFAFQRGPK